MGVGTQPTDDPSVEPEDTDELLEEIERKRSLRGPATVAVSAVAVLFSLFQMILAARSFTVRFTLPLLDRQVELFALQQLQANAIHVTFALVLAFLLFPPTDGTGAVARRLGAGADAVARLGPGPRRATESVRGAVRWFAVDPIRDRVTPVDLVLVVLSLTSPLYYLQEFDEISNVLRVRGLDAGRPIGEVYPVLEPLTGPLTAVGLPLDASYALIVGTVGVLLVLEATRRALGTFLAGLVAAFVAYAYFGHYIPREAAFVGILSIPQLSWENVVRNLWFTSQGVFGIPVTVSVRFIFIFILFGAFLETSGAGRWFIDFAYALTGSRRGGPAKASVLSSGFMGMLSGSSIANTVTTGAFTIPLMKRSGYSPEFSGGVEASSSSGGQILPPVMGAAAFLIVEYTGTPYGEVIVAAAVPAIAFFFGMWVMVHFEASRHGIGGVDRSMLPRVGDLLRRGWFYLVPIVLLLYYLVIRRLSVGRSGWYTIVAVVALVALVAAWSRGTRVPLLAGIAVGFLAQTAALATSGVGLVGLASGTTGSPLGPVSAVREAVSALDVIALLVSVVVLLARPGVESRLLELDERVDNTAAAVAERAGRPGLADNQAYRFGTFIVESMDSGARTATTVVVAVAAAGVIPGVISVSGLGPNLTSLIVTLSGGSLVLTLLIAGVAALILGLGMPTTVMYILLVATLGGALEGLGVPILAAHLFVLYFGLMADVTPPVAVAAYAAAGVAKADEWSTGRIAFLLSLNKILVPFAFVFSPGILLLRRTEGEVVLLSAADLADPVYLLTEVAIPIAGVFAGVWALGVAIIGFYDEEVPSAGRVGYGLASVLLMVPALLLSPAGTGLGMLGVDLVAYTTTTDVLARVGGGALLAALLFGTVRDDDRVVA